jgi:hypothetical protein
MSPHISLFLAGYGAASLVIDIVKTAILMSRRS